MVSTVMSELGGEKIDIIEWNEDPSKFIAEALSPARIVDMTLFKDEARAVVKVTEDQQSLAIGKGGQNVRLAAKLTGWKIDIQAVSSDGIAKDGSEDMEKESE
jgi:N utilization substance protein A